MTTGSAPSSAAARVIAAPIPLAPPVMRMTLPLSCKSIESGGVQPKDVGFLSRAQIARVVLDDLLHLRIARGEQADRPIRAEHQALASECLEYCVQVRCEITLSPAFPIGFCYKTRDFAVHIRTLRKAANRARPSGDLTTFDGRFGEMIDHKLLRREAANQFVGGGKLAEIDKDVIGEIVSSEAAYPVQEIFAHHEAVIGFRLNDMAEAAQLLIFRKVFQTPFNVAVQQVYPSDYSGNGFVVFRQIQQKFRLFLV